MRTYVLTHLSDAGLLRDLDALVAQERTATAAVLAHIAEVDARRLYLPAGYSSMHAYCVGKLRLSEDAASKRIQAARAARQSPALFIALAEGRLHLTGLGLLAPHLTVANANDLLAAATHRSKSEIEQLIAERFPRTELMPLIQAIPVCEPLALAQVDDVPERVRASSCQHAPAHVEAPVPRPRVAPLSAERFALQFMIGKDTYDKLQYVQALLSHRLPSGDVAQVFDRALDALRSQLEKQKFAATTKPRPRSRRSIANARHIPADVKRAVWQRDQGQCTFVSERGQRCGARKFVEFDHVAAVARGGQATVECVRLLCRGHNQLEAERAFGTEFMNDKREEARRAAARTRAAAAEARARAAEAEARSRAVAKEHARDVMACLRELGFNLGEARRAVEFCETIPDATLEERVRAALKFLCPKARRVGASGGAPQRDAYGAAAMTPGA